MRRERASTPAVRAHLPPSLALVAPARMAEDRCSAQPRSSASPAEVSERRRMTMEASGNRTGKGFQIRTQAAAAETRRIAARGMTGAAPASTAAAASGPAAVRMPASEAQAWAKTHTEPAGAAARTGSAADSAGAAHTGAAVRTDSAAGSDRAAVRTPASEAQAWAKTHTDSGPAGRTVPIQIRAAGSSDTPLAVDCGQPSGTGFHLRACSEAEPGPTHFQVHAPVNASAPATTSSYVPLIGIPMR